MTSRIKGSGWSAVTGAKVIESKPLIAQGKRYVRFRTAALICIEAIKTLSSKSRKLAAAAVIDFLFESREDSLSLTALDNLIVNATGGERGSARRLQKMGSEVCA